MHEVSFLVAKTAMCERSLSHNISFVETLQSNRKGILKEILEVKQREELSYECF